MLALPASIISFITTILWPNKSVPPPYPASYLRFHLRHEHALSPSSQTIFRDAPSPNAAFASSDAYDITFHPVSVYRPRALTSGSLLWDPDKVLGPNVSSRVTLQALAKMTNNAYSEPGAKDWYGLGEDWSVGFPFGWEPDADGFRGHIFVSEDNSTVVIAIKGTSAGRLVGGGGPTVKKDKLNDNLLFSCCCARVGPTWSPVCGCYSGSYKCDQECVEQALIEDSLFYPVGVNLYNNISYMYPDANIWLTGHSLGGSLAALLGATFGAPTVAFEAPAEALAASRLHLPSPPATDHIVHVYHTADPIPMGVCNGVASWCATGGFAFETRCHLGRILRYDTVSKLGWSVGISTHGIRVVIDRVLADDWEPGLPGAEVPEWFVEDNCEDLTQECFKWEFGRFKEKEHSLGVGVCV